MKKDGYIEFVAQKAKEQGKLFFLDTGEGNDFFDEDKQWDIEDLSGWLVDPLDRDKFINSKKNNTAYDEFSDAYVFVKWNKRPNQELEIIFKYY